MMAATNDLLCAAIYKALQISHAAMRLSSAVRADVSIRMIRAACPTPLSSSKARSACFRHSLGARLAALQPRA